MVSIDYSTLLKILFLFCIFSKISSSTVLSDYKYLSPEIFDNIVRVAIIGTNDIHVEIFPNVFQSSENTTLKRME